jgi:hypothetical protein
MLKSQLDEIAPTEDDEPSRDASNDQRQPDAG